MNDIFFTADWHFGHSNVIPYSNRPFLQEGDILGKDTNNKYIWVSDNIRNQRAEEMKEFLIEKHNAIVKKGDLVYFLGDIGLFKGNDYKKKIENLADRLNGQIHWIFGNHDSRKMQKAEGFAWKGHLKIVRIEHCTLMLCHYPMHEWYGSRKGSWNLHGHCHGRLLPVPNKLRLDVGIDTSNYVPLNWEEVKGKIRNGR